MLENIKLTLSIYKFRVHKKVKVLSSNAQQDPKSVAERTGLEPATPCVTGRYSNQLNYRSFFFSLVMTYSHIANATLPSALLRFTSVFGMVTGGSKALSSPDNPVLKIYLTYSLSFQLFALVLLTDKPDASWALYG